MKKNRQWKPFALLAIIVPLLLIVLTSFRVDSFSELFVPAIIFFVLYPILVTGLYMWTTGNGYGLLNIGMAPSSVGIDNAKECASYAGKFISIGSILIMISVSGLFVQLILGILGIVISVIVMLYPAVTINAKNGTHKGKKILPGMNGRKALAVIAVASIVALVPSYILVNADGNYGGSVTISMDETTFTVSAPLFNHTFEYANVDDCYLDDNFDRGRRIGGYGTTTVSSGTFNNDQFGMYRLASYNKIPSCIVISYEGKMYAFNQSSAEFTDSAYEELLKRLPVIP